MQGSTDKLYIFKWISCILSLDIIGMKFYYLFFIDV